MARNRFEQVDELQPDAINLTLIQKSDGRVGIIYCPKTASPDLPDDLTSYEMPIRDAVSGAIQLANTKKIALVVIDRDNIWKTDWGDLWRYQDEVDEDEPPAGDKGTNSLLAKGRAAIISMRHAMFDT